MITAEKFRALSPAEIERVKQGFAGDCKTMLERMAAHTECSCGAGGLNELSHAAFCPVSVMLRAARAVWMLAQPRD